MVGHEWNLWRDLYRGEFMIPWWAGFLMFIGGMIVGILIYFLNDNDDDPPFKYLKKK